MSATGFSDTVRSLIALLIFTLFVIAFVFIRNADRRLDKIESLKSTEQLQNQKPQEVNVNFDFKFDRGNVWLFLRPENQADVNRLADLFLYLDEEGKYSGEAIGIDITALLAYANAKQNYRVGYDPSPFPRQEPPAGSQEGQEGKPKPTDPPPAEKTP